MPILEPHWKYILEPELINLIDKYAFDISEFGKTDQLRKIYEFACEVNRGAKVYRKTYKTALGDIVELDSDGRNASNPYYLIINGKIIYDRYIKDIQTLIRLEKEYN